MPRTTLDIDAPILRELKKLQKREKKSLGRLATELLAHALKERTRRTARPRLEWISQPMGMKIDITDKDALYEALDEDLIRKLYPERFPARGDEPEPS